MFRENKNGFTCSFELTSADILHVSIPQKCRKTTSIEHHTECAGSQVWATGEIQKISASFGVYLNESGVFQ